MNYQCYLGIDISKLTFDYCMLSSEGTILRRGEVQNNKADIQFWIQQLQGQLDVPWNSILVCMEHSGYYNSILLKTLNESVRANVWVESSLQIKRSGGIQRGKDDPLDALRIACYALDFQRNARLWKPKTINQQRLALLVSHRDRMVKNLMSIRNSINEEEGMVNQEVHEEIQEVSSPAIQALQQAIDEFDSQIQKLLKEDEEMNRQSQIIQSIPGFGQVIASKLIIVTQGFTRLNNPRSLACFAGVAPFPHRSGTSIRGKNKISHFANKEIKKMLHLAALVTIRKNNIMHDFYHRKVSEGKNKMSVINAIRNKLIHILMALIKKNSMYQKNYHHLLG